MRAVHLELSHSLDTDAFINALRRFISRRGKLHTFFSDNGSNFVGGHQELRRSIQNVNQEIIEARLKQDEIQWKVNPPYASHMGGIWERVIHSIRRILTALSSQNALIDDLLSHHVTTSHGKDGLRYIFLINFVLAEEWSISKLFRPDKYDKA